MEVPNPSQVSTFFLQIDLPCFRVVPLWYEGSSHANSCPGIRGLITKSSSILWATAELLDRIRGVVMVSYGQSLSLLNRGGDIRQWDKLDFT